MKTLVRFLAVVVVLWIVLSLVTYQVDETEQVLVLQFGKPLDAVSEPGLHFKLPPPFRTIERFEKRLLVYDSPPDIIVTQDKKNLEVDAFARWKITDPLLFRQTVRTEAGAQARLDAIIYSDMLRELGQHDMDDIVSDNRDEIMVAITQEASDKSVDYGIEILDVRIKRTDLPQENEDAIYRRMEAERMRIANLYRSEGEEEALKLRAEADRQIKVIKAEAYRESKIIRGTAEAKAIDIFADAFNRDPDFYDFTRTMEMYRKTLDERTTVILPPSNDLFKYLR